MGWERRGHKPFSSRPAGEFPPLVFLPPREGRSLFPEPLPFKKTSWKSQLQSSWGTLVFRADLRSSSTKKGFGPGVLTLPLVRRGTLDRSVGCSSLGSECLGYHCSKMYGSHSRHLFHKSCVDPWLLDHRTCPMCKMNILKALGIPVSTAQPVASSCLSSHAVPKAGRKRLLWVARVPH